MNLDQLITDHLKLDKCKNDKERACLLQEKINELQDLVQKMQSLKDKTRQNIFEEWKQITKEKFPELHPLEKGEYTDVTFDSISGKRMNVIINESKRDGLYCEIHTDPNLSQEERKIENTKVMELKLQGVLPSQGYECIWKYLPNDDYDGVFNLFLEIVERCKKLVD